MNVTSRRLFLWGQKLAPFLPKNMEGQCYTNGVLRRGAGRAMSIESPSDDQIVGELRAASASEVDAAVAFAHATFQEKHLLRTVEDRLALCRALGDRIRSRAEELATSDSLCMGMPIRDARDSIERAAACFHDVVKMVEEQGALSSTLSSSFEAVVQGNTTPSPHEAVVTPEPIGVCAFLTPFNYPLEMFAWKVAPCLAAGNAVVWKPPESAPLSSFVMAQILHDIEKEMGEGMRGWIHIVQGDGAVGAQLASHADVRLVGFTGSTRTGAAVQAAAAKSNLKRVQLELGGNACLLAGLDADITAVANLAMQAFNNSGQSCTATRRVLVPEDRLRQLILSLVPLVKNRRLGHALDPSTEMGPVVSAAALQRVLDSVLEATSHGSVKQVVGGFRATLPRGHYCTPTVLVAHDPSAAILQEEVFGPVLTLVPYAVNRSNAETRRTSFVNAVRLANQTKYGLSGVVVSQDQAEIAVAQRGLQCGTVWVNTVDAMNSWTPFGGVKESGYGKDLGIAAILGYSTMKTVTSRTAM